jgi:hypothetical protein
MIEAFEVNIPGIPGGANHWFPGQRQARRAALAAARQLGLGYRISHDPRPRRGLPHYHLAYSDGRPLERTHPWYGHFFYGRRPPRRIYRGRPWREFESELEAEPMAQPLRGRSRPGRGVGIVRLYHYSPIVIRDSVRSNSYWTEFGSRNPQNVARITGRDPTALRYCYVLRMTRAERDRIFRNVGTVMRPGLPPADEYQNRVAIPISWIQRVTPMR